MIKVFVSILILLSVTLKAQTIISAGPFFATAGEYFTMTVEMSGTPSNPYNINLVSPLAILTPWSSYNTIGNTYSISYLLRDYEKIGHYYLTYGASTYPVPVRIDRPHTPEKFGYQSVSSLNIPVGTGSLDGISYMQADGIGNLYCVGNFTGTCTINGQSITASGARDGFIAKFDSTGLLVWIRKTGSNVDDNLFILEGLNSVETYQDSVVFVTGYMWCDTSLKFNGSVPLNYPSRNIGTQDGVVMKLDSAGNFQWAAFQGSLKQDASNDVEVDDNGSIFLTGFAQSEDFFSSGVGDTSFTYVYNSGATDSIALGAYANDQYGLFVAHYSASGQLLWARRQSRDYFVPGSFPIRMERCSDNTLVILSKGNGQLKWDGTACNSGSCCNPHYALLKLDSLGNRLWCLEDGNFTENMDMGIDSTDYIYITIPTSWTGGDDETFLRKYDPAGTLLWSNHIQHNKENNGNYVSVTDGGGNTYISHAYQNQWANNPRVIVTKKYDSNGQLKAITYPEPVVPFEENKPTAIALSDDGDQIFLAGHFRGAQRFGDTTITSTTRKPFLVSMENCPVTYDSITVNSCGPYITPSGNQFLNSSGYYGDTLMNAAGCDSIILITLNSYGFPVVNALAQGATTFCQGDSVLISASSGLTYYQWYNRSWLIPGATSPNYIAKSNGNYFCIAQNAGLCPDTSNIIIVRVPCIKPHPAVDKSMSNYETNNIVIYPNPVEDILYVNGGDVIPSGYELINTSGQIIERISNNTSAISIDTNEMYEGIYLIKLFYDSEVVIKRFVVIRN